MPRSNELPTTARGGIAQHHMEEAGDGVLNPQGRLKGEEGPLYGLLESLPKFFPELAQPGRNLVAQSLEVGLMIAYLRVPHVLNRPRDSIRSAISHFLLFGTAAAASRWPWSNLWFRG